MTNASKFQVGTLEKCNLPDFQIFDLHIRVDTGAATSSLHVDNIDIFKKDNKDWVAFDIHPDIHDVDTIVRVESPIHDIREIKSSNGDTEKRPVIETHIEMNQRSWPILISLTDRSSMSYLMLLGRQAMSGHITVDPEYDYMLGK